MDQMIALWGLGLLVLVGFLMYPRLMFGLVGSLVRGLFGVLVDAFALLLAWI